MQRLLGQGAMGMVYQAHDPVIDRDVAIKLLRIDLLAGNDRVDFLARFQREAQAAARCAHPNIVAIFDFAMHGGNPFLAMEYVEGISLEQRIRTPFMPDAAVQVMLQVLDALACAHAAGVVHRDVKPANILLLAGDRVKMTDFGIARFDTSDLTQHGAVIGTPSYMSPEQCRGDAVDARSDVFSAGAVLYEMLTGQRPFGRGNATQVIYRLMNEHPPLVAVPDGTIPPELVSVLHRALAKRPEERFPSAAAMAAALQPSPDATLVAPSGAALAPGGTSARRGTVAPGSAAASGSGPTAAPGSMAAPGPAATSGGIAAQGGSLAPAGTQGRVAAAEIARAELALAEYLGPIARVLVKRALPGVASPPALWESLARHIEREADRAAFLRRR